MKITSIIILIIILSAIAYLIYHSIMKCILFKRGGNPFHRICKRCGAHQVMYQSNIIGNEDQIWWEEIYPIGNNEKCKCHLYSEYR